MFSDLGDDTLLLYPEDAGNSVHPRQECLQLDPAGQCRWFPVTAL
ncbi:MAG TPA: hypothetical protein PKH19_03025 [Candidatus Syntrophosphaera sp.]|nr:hypothetical protein [Candidatus Syntrophosphaera sp.]